MYERMPNRKLQWVRAVPGYIPDQAVIFEKRSHGDAIFVARVIDGSITAKGSFVSGNSCAEYLQHGTRQAKCMPTFDFLVLKRGEATINTHVTDWYVIRYLILPDVPYKYLPAIGHVFVIIDSSWSFDKLVHNIAIRIEPVGGLAIFSFVLSASEVMTNFVSVWT